MKRNMELVRKILLAIEASTTVDKPILLRIDGYDDKTISYHVGLLHQVSFVKALDASHLGGSQWVPTQLTWAGHEFLDSARNETVWQRAMATIRENGGSVSLEVLKSLLVAKAMELFGLKG